MMQNDHRALSKANGMSLGETRTRLLWLFACDEGNGQVCQSIRPPAQIWRELQ